MIHLTPPLLNPTSAPSFEAVDDWQTALRGSVRTLRELLDQGWISTNEFEALNRHQIESKTKIRIPEYYASLMTPGDPLCPIRLQAVPGLCEIDPELPGEVQEWSKKVYGRAIPWTPDPIGDLDRLAAPRLTHRYRNRALLHLSSNCGMYCRFCFRKEHLGTSEKELYSGPLDPSFNYLRAHPEIRELIFTGGDPLSLNDSLLLRVLERISEETPQIRVVRFHSRMAVTLPQRLTSNLADTLGRDWPFQIHLVSHFNHPRELTALAHQGLRRLARKGVTLWNQNVLLRGINDQVDTLEQLYQGLYEWGVAPFYLHHADLTPGTFAFRTSIETGRWLMRALKGRLPGPALPDYVLDVPGGLGKVPLLDTHRVRLEPLASPLKWTLPPMEAQVCRSPQAEARLYAIEPSETRRARRSGEDPLLYLDIAPSGEPLAPGFAPPSEPKS